MTTDMSPSAVRDRLHLMDELWELSVKLMGAKESNGHATEDSSDPAAVPAGGSDERQGAVMRG